MLDVTKRIKKWMNDWDVKFYQRYSDLHPPSEADLDWQDAYEMWRQLCPNFGGETN